MVDSWNNLIRQMFWEMNPQTNYHGSGAIFDEFSDKFVGTGEGHRAHGWGHYSADNKNTAAKYVLEKGKPIYVEGRPDMTIRELTDIQKQNKPINWVSDYLYKVNVPNENLMLNEYLPINEQPKSVQLSIKKLLEDLPNIKLHEYDNEYNNIRKTISKLKNNNLYGRDFYYNLAELVGNNAFNDNIDYYTRPHGEKRASKLLSKYGIKGIRGEGYRDKGINVTFSDKDIKMANTPVQRFINRLPIKTASKMAYKLYDTLDKSVVPIMIYEGLSQPIANEGNYNPSTGRFELGIEY